MAVFDSMNGSPTSEATLTTTVSLLRSSRLFSGMPQGAIEDLARSSSIVDVPAGTPICHIRDSGAEMWLVISGMVEVSIPAKPEGTEPGPIEPVRLRVAGPGEWIGEIACLEGGTTRTATCVAKEPSRILELPGDALMAALRTSPEAAIAVIRQLAGRVRAHAERLNRAERLEPREDASRGLWDLFSSFWVGFFAGPKCFVLHLAACVMWFVFLDRSLFGITLSLNLLTNIVSLEAIALCIFILVGQRLQDRQQRVRAEELYHWANGADERTVEILQRLTELESRLGFERLRGTLSSIRSRIPPA